VRVKALFLAVLVSVLCLLPITESPRWLSWSTGYYRIVVLSDAHLPVRPEIKDAAVQQRIIAAKNKVVEDINAWGDINQIAVIGDLSAGLGTEQELTYAAQYFSRFNKPQSIVLGNHDYIYESSLSPFGGRIRAEAAYREGKINRFKQTFKMSETFYSQKIGRYLLLFLSTDSLESQYLTQISERQLAWLREELARYPAKPTLVFFHAPLKGTVSDYRETANSSDFVAQPDQVIAAVLLNNPQIFLWISGHIHIPATNPDFASQINVMDGRVTAIHNADMDRETIWTNSIYLYQDKVMIKTFDHKNRVWLDRLERTIQLPNTVGHFKGW